MNSFLQSTPWDPLFSTDPNSSPESSSHHLLFLMNQYVPSHYVHYVSCWMSPNVLSKIRICQNLYRCAKRINSPILMSTYRILRNQISSEIKAYKSSFDNSLSSSPSNNFWSYSQSLHKSKTPIHNLLPTVLWITRKHLSKLHLLRSFQRILSFSNPPSLIQLQPKC